MDVGSDSQPPDGNVISLCNGITARVRAISPDDGPALEAFHGRLSDQSKYLRYLSPHPVLSAEEVAHLTCVDGVDRVALVAEVDGKLIAVGRYDRLRDHAQAEVAFVVADAYQHHFIATELLYRLAHEARMEGVSCFKAKVSSEDATMLSVFREAGFALLSSTPQWGTVELTLDIA